MCAPGQNSNRPFLRNKFSKVFEDFLTITLFTEMTYIYDKKKKCKLKDLILTLRRPLRRKLRMRWFSTFPRWRSRVFFKSDLTDPPQIFDAHLLENTDLSPSRFHFSVGFISRSCFESDGFIAYSNEWDWREKNDVYSH